MRSILIQKKRRDSALLAMLVLPAVYLFYGPYNEAWAVNLSLFTILAISYWRSITRSTYREIFIVLQILTVGVIGALYSPWSLALAFYPGLIIGVFVPERSIRRYAGLMAVVIFVSILTFFIFRENEWHFYWLPMVIAITAMPFIARIYRRSIMMNHELRNANEEITRLIKNEERQRISRDLHDSVGHTLSLITLKSELMERLIRNNPEEAIEEAKALQSISRSVLLHIRKLISDMQAIDIDEELKHADEVFAWANIILRHDNRCEIEEISSITRNILGMCLRECTTNVLKHSRAKNCTVSLHTNAGKYMLYVNDDGKGFSINDGDTKDFGNGLHGMKERLSLIGGKLQVNTSSKGTNVTIIVPKM
ncbi:sensor histidine kinase [Virgibacillus ihumii]|uniref:sensor histidine kinase n=1 Tax=Virgibacillus ihumii TaxID=2686091 RepID=UPI00157DA94F|nr:sensor histidine kinase [Virgibacillus ihumii]